MSKGNTILGQKGSKMSYAGGDPKAERAYTVVNFMSGGRWLTYLSDD
jgi:hypothetical protein